MHIHNHSEFLASIKQHYNFDKNSINSQKLKFKNLVSNYSYEIYFKAVKQFGEDIIIPYLLFNR